MATAPLSSLSSPPADRLSIRGVIGACLVLVLGLLLAQGAYAKGAEPADLLKGQVILSDHGFPMSWSSPGEYAAKVRAQSKQSLLYDKKTGKVTVYYAAFFALPVNDVQVNLVIFDITGGGKIQKTKTEAFLNRKGDRTLFHSVELDKEDLEMNKRYLFAIESGRKIIASGQLILRGEGPHYSGKVTFTDDETKK